MRLFLPTLVGVLALAAAAQAQPASLPHPDTLVARATPVEFTKWKGKPWRGQHYGWNRGRHRGWDDRPYRRRTYYRVYF